MRANLSLKNYSTDIEAKENLDSVINGSAKPIVNQQPVSVEIWQYLLQQKIPQSALETKFIEGIAKGTLHVDNYTQFMIQDIAYLKHGSDNWLFAAKLAKQQNKSDIEQYCLQRSDRWLQYATGLSQKYHVKLDGIIIGKELKEYIDYESYITSKYGPEYVFIAVYACVKLWPYIANELKKRVIDENDQKKDEKINNIYQFWVDDNLSEKSAKRTEKWINELYDKKKINKELALEIVSNCLRLEVNFFKQACQEEPEQLKLYESDFSQDLKKINLGKYTRSL